MTDTIFALSSGLPPAGIAVVRISGTLAGPALKGLAGRLPASRRASYRRLHDAAGAVLDDALILWLPGPATATGEDLAELHLHGGRAVVAAALAALGAMPGLRMAEAGEFTRRAFENGRIDLTEAEGLADLLSAETEAQRHAALALAEGGLGRQVEAWQTALLSISAMIEADLDFSDEGDVAETAASSQRDAAQKLAWAMTEMLENPPAERLRDGVRIVLAGPPNSGKSSLFNVLVDRDAAIVSPIAGTTRDRIEAPVVLDGLPLLLIDTAGLRNDTGDEIEAIGIGRAEAAMAGADIILWLGAAGDAPADAVVVRAKADLGGEGTGLPVSVTQGTGLVQLRAALIDRARSLLPGPDELSLNARHRGLIAEAANHLGEATTAPDPLIAAEHLRLSRATLDRITGRAGTEDMLDALFGRFCVGK